MLPCVSKWGIGARAAPTRSVRCAPLGNQGLAPVARSPGAELLVLVSQAMSAVENLRQQREQVNRNLGAVRKALHQQGDRDKKRRRRQPERTPTWTGSFRDVQLCLCALSLLRWDCAEAVTVLQHVLTPPNWAHLTTAEQTTLLEDLFLSRDLELVESWMHEHSQGNHQRPVMLWRSLAEKKWRTGCSS